MWGKKERKFKFMASPENISQVVDAVDGILREFKVAEVDAVKASLRLEDLIVLLISHAPKGTEITVSVSRMLGRVNIKLIAQGEEFALEDLDTQMVEGIEDEEERSAILNMLGHILKQNVSIYHKKGLNICSIKVAESSQRMLLLVVIAALLGIVFGLGVKALLPQAILTLLAHNVFDTIIKVFMNALMALVGGMVFFSIADSIASGGDIKAMGRIATKVFGGYTATSFLAIGVGYLAYQLMPCGDPALATGLTSAELNKIAVEAPSLKGLLLSIVPADLLSPFMKLEMLQIIFLAVLIGVVCSILKNEEPQIGSFLSVGNKIFAKGMELVVTFIPLMVFSSVVQLFLTLPTQNLLSMLAFIPLCYFGYLLMLVAYSVLLIIFGRVNPLWFLRKFAPAILVAFSTSSSNIAMPTSMKQCDEGLGISKKIYSFSIPLGTTINMDGCCIYFMALTMYVASVYQITLTNDAIISLVVAALAISMGASGIPGGCVVYGTIMLRACGLPVEGLCLVMGILPLIDSGLTALNVTGDAVITMIVAKSEGLVSSRQ